MKKSVLLNIKTLGLILIIVLCLLLVGCNNKTDDENGKTDNQSGDNQGGEVKPIDDDPKEEDPANVTVTNWKILEGTDSVTTVYKFTTDKEGPKVAIVGGIHGDETAGWTAGLRLVTALETEKGICGEILLIPQANILADKADSRYKVTGYDFSDLNRSFPVGRYESAKEASIQISSALVETVEAFEPDYIIDLHESLHSWEQQEEGLKTTLGNTLIASNNSRFMRQLIRRYNDTYRLESETEFRQEGANQLGSFNYYFTTTYPDKVIYTIETNRGYENGVNTIDLEIRVRHQLNILEAMFDLIWTRS